MSDGLPTDEQLARIERGVRSRIDRRARVARRVAGASAAVLVVAGGVALLLPLRIGGFTTGTSAGGGSSAARTVAVVCHDGGVVRARAAEAGLPGTAIAACERALGRPAPAGASAAADGASGAPSALRTAPVPRVCTTEAGVVHVWLDGRGCPALGVRPQR